MTPMTRRAFLSAAAAAAALAACGGKTARVAIPKRVLPAGFVAPGTDADLDLVANFWAAIAAGAEKNLAFSPYSIRRALAMAWAGARGMTADEIAHALGFGSSNAAAVHDAFNGIRRELEGRSADGLTLTVADSMWVQEGFAVHDTYRDVITSGYGAEVLAADFERHAPDAVDAINSWVAGKTNDRIKKLFTELDDSYRLVLADAVYFLADWATPFDKFDTRPRPFHRFDGRDADVATMSRFGSMSVGRAGSATAVELPYTGDHLAMLFLLPDGTKPADLDAAVSGTTLRDVTAALAPKQVQLSLPKFTFSAHEQLIPALQTLGIHEAFIDQRADFHGIANADLVIGAVEHEVFIRVDEKGTEAAAATGVGIRATSAPVAQETVTFDRPFAFVLRDRPTGAVLVAGRVIDPS